MKKDEIIDLSVEDENKQRSHNVFRFSLTRLLLGIYDIFILALVEYVLLVTDDAVNITVDLKSKILLCVIIFVFLAIFRIFSRVYDQIWRYGGIQGYIRLIFADSAACIFTYVIERFVLGGIFNFLTPITFARTLVIFTTTLLASISIRLIYHYAYKCCKRDTKTGRFVNYFVKLISFNKVVLKDSPNKNKIKIAIVGAGRVGSSLAEELLGSRSSAYEPVCFIDIDNQKIGRRLSGLPIVSAWDNIENIIDKYSIQEVVIAMTNLDGDTKKEIYEQYNDYGCQVKLYDYPLIQKAGENRRYLRDFDIEELLFRKSLVILDEKTSDYYKNKTVLITGGGGSIGGELCRQVAKMNPKKLVILDVYENGAYDIQQELRIAYGNELNLDVVILSFCNRPALEKVFDKYRPNVVINAAAHKHVPFMEDNCCEAVENNVFGTLNCVELSEKYGVERFMMVSTDKAVNPTNVMGATKRMCEMIVQCHSKDSKTTSFSATRFGNVLGSAGSVVPLFKRQIQNGGPVTITDRRIIRYFMTIPEASQLVLTAGAMAENGELFVLDMGKPVRILDMVENMIRLVGLKPYEDIEIKEIGLRPGEKLYEELLVKTEELDKTENELIFIERDEPVSADELNKKLNILRQAVETGDDEVVRKALHEVVPTFREAEKVNAKAVEAEEMKMVSE